MMSNQEKVEENNQMEETQVDVAQCPGCGANIAFDPDSQMLKCEYCGTTVDFEKTQSTEKQSIQKLADNRDNWKSETNMYSCAGCGAVEILHKSEIAKECPYCRSTNIVAVSGLSGVKPDAVLPFGLDKQSASDVAQKWVVKKFFAPKVFKKSFESKNLRGVYNPAFVFDSDTFSKYHGQLGKHYTTVRKVNGRTETVTHTRWFNVSGTHYEKYQDVTIQACEKISVNSMSKIAPFDVTQASIYTDNFLQGFQANHYQKDGLKCWDDAKVLINRQTDKRIMQSLRSKYHFDVVGRFKIDTHCYNINYEYTLLPVYVGHCNYGKKDYNYFINGYTGKIFGKTPVSKGKVSLLFGLGAVLLAAAALAIFFI
ncbi:MAG: hypothetical protein LBU60_04260 [Clostridiales bacterium]|jgi:DNA-directed RNA polymerase subunit RPC12/RpoP|nr:hypothetical protein [Clostridiales bacterium]